MLICSRIFIKDIKIRRFTFSKLNTVFELDFDDNIIIFGNI